VTAATEMSGCVPARPSGSQSPCDARHDSERFITDGGFEVAYQPVIDLGSGECIGLEALARSPEPPQTFGAAEGV
jgi:EAL domain-containing protein (putative c-di-GMP-specific phosphodiesterase class I)